MTLPTLYIAAKLGTQFKTSSEHENIEYAINLRALVMDMHTKQKNIGVEAELACLRSAFTN